MWDTWCSHLGLCQPPFQETIFCRTPTATPKCVVIPKGFCTPQLRHLYWFILLCAVKLRGRLHNTSSLNCMLMWPAAKSLLICFMELRLVCDTVAQFHSVFVWLGLHESCLSVDQVNWPRAFTSCLEQQLNHHTIPSPPFVPASTSDI